MSNSKPELNRRMRDIKPVHAWLDLPGVQECVATYGRETTTQSLRALLDAMRKRVGAGESVWEDREVIERLKLSLQSDLEPALKRVINATGILLHTGLGRSPLSEAAVEAIRESATSYCNLEFRLEDGTRGRRADLIREQIRKITGAEAATVVNNNAAATIIALRALAGGREVIVSRGQLVEIGGGFRLPEIMAVSGAVLREVGTTNKTRIADFENAIGPNTGAILRVHSSNYAIIGFTEEPSIAELAALAHEHGVPFIDDIGSGALTAESIVSGRKDPIVAESLAAGADLVLFSGDKLMGGPQCGLIVGTNECVSQVEKDPLMRAFRVDKLTLAALGATLAAWTDAERRNREIPFWQKLNEPMELLRQRAVALAGRIALAGWHAVAQESSAYAGGGSLPSETIPSWAVVIRAPWPETIGNEAELAQRLRTGRPPLVARLHEGGCWLDMRSIAPDEDQIVAELFQKMNTIGKSNS